MQVQYNYTWLSKNDSYFTIKMAVLRQNHLRRRFNAMMMLSSRQVSAGFVSWPFEEGIYKYYNITHYSVLPRTPAMVYICLTVMSHDLKYIYIYIYINIYIYICVCVCVWLVSMLLILENIFSFQICHLHMEMRVTSLGGNWLTLYNSVNMMAFDSSRSGTIGMSFDKKNI